jgi:hypothetical protein
MDERPCIGRLSFNKLRDRNGYSLSIYIMIYHGRKSSRRTGKLVLTYAINMLLELVHRVVPYC